MTILAAPPEYALGAIAAGFLVASCPQLGTVFQPLRWALLLLGIAVLSLRFFLARTAARAVASKFMYLLSFFIAISALTLVTTVSFDFSTLKFVALLCLLFVAWRGASDVLAAYGPSGASRVMLGMAVHPAGPIALSLLGYFGIGPSVVSNSGFGGYIRNSNGLGVLILIVLPWSASALFRSSRQSRERRFAFALVFLVLGYGLLLTAARGSIVGALLAFSVLCAVHADRKVAAILILFSALAGARTLSDPALLPSLAQRYFYKQRYAQALETNPLQSRIGPWKVSERTFLENPWLGLGFGVTSRAEMNWSFSSRSGPGALETGSSLWSSLVQVGLLGSVPLFLAVVLLMIDAGRFAWRVKDPRFTGLYGSALALAVSAAFEGWLIAPGSFPATYFWLQCFFLNAVMSRYRPAPARAASPAFGLRPSLGLTDPSR